MMQYLSKCLGIGLFISYSLAAGDDAGGRCISRKLRYPELVDVDELSAANETLTLDFEWVEINPGFGDQDGYENGILKSACGSKPFMTRALGGSVPGPTLTVSPGVSMKIKFKNKLTYQSESKSSRIVLQEINGTGGVIPTEEFVFTTEMDLSRLNKFNDPDVANLHFHGLHVPGVLPGDDSTLEVLPQEEYEYIIDIPEDHEPGLHWVHPHHHGSSLLHMAGGAALALVVKDQKDSLPEEIREATERLMVFQEWDFEEALEAAKDANDKLTQNSFSRINGEERFVTINGQYQPITEITVGKWERWRFLYAGWQDLPLNFGPTSEGNTADCEFHLLAKDGIYISDYPRGPMLSTTGEELPIPPGGRADFMVRCNNAGATTRFQALGRTNVLVVNCVEEQSEGDDHAVLQEVQKSTTALTAWKKSSTELPDYLQSVMDSPASEGCRCDYHFQGRSGGNIRVNGRSYRPGNYFIHTSYLGAVVERSLKGMGKHSYHQHVYPFQLVSFSDGESYNENAYFKIGDWHDTYQDENLRAYDNGRVTIRYKTTDMPGKIMVHCHNSEHSDSGMIQKEYVRDRTDGGSCKCDIFGPIDGPGIIDDITTTQWYSSAVAETFTSFVQFLPVVVGASFLVFGL